MFVPATVKARVEAKIRECIDTVKAKYGQEMKYPNVVYHKRGTTAGTANCRTWTIDLNPVLLMENQDDFIARTVPHELAHLACDLIYPEAHRPGYGYKRDIHGARWQSIMIALGADPKRCHNYDTSTSKVVKSNGRQIEFKCSKCATILKLTPMKAARVDADPYGLWHRGCKGHPLIRVGSTTQAPVQTPSTFPKLTIDLMDSGVLQRVPAPVPQQPAPKVNEPVGTSKIDICKGLYQRHRGQPRSTNIKMFVNAGCTPAGANTYYATCKKLFG